MKITVNLNIETDFDSINELMRINNALSRTSLLEDCFIDMTKIYWFNGALCSLFKALLRHWIVKNKIRIMFRFNPAIRDIFYRNGFMNGESLDLYETIFPVRDFRVSEIETFLRCLDNDFTQNRFPFPGDFTRDTQRCLGEIFSNAQRHSEAEWIYTSGQFFPNKEQITFCITDAGVGIAKKVKDKLHSEIDSKDAIDWAFVEGNSTKDHSGGLGLYELRKKAEEHNGELIIVSNDVHYDVLSGVARKLQFDFGGTSAILTLSCKG